jgi:hypothetical protein
VDETYTQLDPNALPVNSVKLGPTEPLWIHKGAGSGPIQYWIQAIDRHGSTSKEEYVASVGRRMETSLVEYPRPATLSAPAATCVLTGRLIGDGSPLGGRKVVLDGGTSETNLVANLMTTVTGADGSFSFAVRPTAKTYYQSRFEGDETGTPVTGISSCVTPKVILTRSTSWSTLRRRRAYYAKGFIQPAHSRGDLNKVRIYAYRKGRDGAYHYVKSFSASYSPYSSTKTRYSARVILGQRGAWKLVAYHAADTRHAATSGSADYLTVK